jgi:methylenetetrahydrofolate dehydrogenase (NADP+)/methenyltetrahydrofolate cyclohydrolase
MEIISGTQLAKKIKTEIAQKLEKIKGKNQRLPKLSIILVGNDPNSLKYVKSKEKACLEAGMLCQLHLLPEEITQEKLLDVVARLNADPTTDGILIQLPLPSHLNTEKILENVDYHKDADGLHPMNAGKLADGSEGLLPCTPKGIISLLKEGRVEMRGKHAVVLGRSNLVGKPIAQLLLRENATVTICHTATKNLKEMIAQADILVLAMGSFGVVTPDMLKKDVVLIDVAMNWENNHLVGDLYCEENMTHLEQVVSIASPVPGGVGPMTIASLIENTFEIYSKNQNI